MVGRAWIGAVGDVFINRPKPRETFVPARPLIAELDLFFGNCEGVYTDSDVVAPSCGFRVAAPTAMMAGLEDVGFDVMALANNHMIDCGHDAFTQMLERLGSLELECVGAGRNLAEARRPVIREVNGTRIGFLSYTMVMQAGYQARANLPGVSALRIHSVPYFPQWDPYGRVEPGAQPHMRTFPWPEDVALLKADIAALKEEADLVFVSMHWGDSRLPVVLTDYEVTLGHAAVDAGADVILGHHHHFLKAVEYYRGKPIFYGLGHYAFDLLGLETLVGQADIGRLRRFSEWAIFPRTESPGYPFHHDTRYTGFALFGIEDKAVTDVRFAPFYIDPHNATVPCHAETGLDPTTAYLEAVTREAGFGTRFAGATPIGGVPTFHCLPPEG